MFNYISTTKISFWTLPKPHKVENDPKIKSKSKVRIGGTIENISCSTTWVDPKTVFEPYPDPTNSPLGPKKVKNSSKMKTHSKVRIKESIDNECCATILVDPKTFFKIKPTPKNQKWSKKAQNKPQKWNFGPQTNLKKAQKRQKDSKKQKLQNEIYQYIWVN